MTEIQRIVAQMKAAFEGQAWHGPSVLEVLQDVDYIMAASNFTVHGADSIWELVGHLTTTADVVRRRIEGESAGLKDEEFWPEVARGDRKKTGTAPLPNSSEKRKTFGSPSRRSPSRNSTTS